MPWIETRTYAGFTEKMAEEDENRSNDLTINCWPTAIDGIDWSQDGEIVIGAGDDVQLLVCAIPSSHDTITTHLTSNAKIPKLQIIEDAPDAMWELLRLRATSFTDTELPHQEPIATRHWSIGEEISTADVVKARWTPSGIAKNGRCALLVLTQNLLLSLWAPEKQARSHQDWQRRVIINRDLQNYFENLRPDLKPKEGESMGEKMKELVRVRTFAVNQPLQRGDEKGLENACLIAVSNDNNEVVILRCEGGHGEDGKTQVKVETHFSITDEEAPIPSHAWTFEDYMEQTRYVQHLAWSPWMKANDGRMRCLLACGTRSAMVFKWITLNDCFGTPGIRVDDFDSVIRLKKSWAPDTIVQWLPDLDQLKYGRLIAVTIDKVFLFTVNLLEDERVRSSKFERSAWSQTAGVMHSEMENESKLLQMIPHTTSKTDFLTAVSLDGMKQVDDYPTGLQEAISFNRSIFDGKFAMRGSVSTRLWGLATCPLSDLIVTCATFHPSDSPEYIIPADMSARVIFQSTERKDFITRAIQQGASTEAIAFSAKWLVKSMKTQPEKNQAIWNLLDQIDKVIGTLEVVEPDPATSSLKDLLFTSNTLVRLRYERVLSVMMGRADAAEEIEKQVMEQLAIRVLNIPTSRFKSGYSSQLMLSNFRRVLILLKLSAEDDKDLMTETCGLCSSEIPFTDYTSARCTKNHELRRCALTFLAIQAPDMCKFCGICGKQFLKASEIEGQVPRNNEDVDVEMQDGSRPLTELLCEACDRCVYCAGKFIG
jgi:hypothetical protein